MLVLALTLPATALALPSGCETATDPGAVTAALETTDDQLAAGEVEAARERLSEVHRSLLCLAGAASPQTVSRLARQLAVAFFFDQDDMAVRRWLQSARAATPSGPWPKAAPEGHPVHDIDDDLSTHRAGPEGVGIVAPRKGGAFLNGQFLAGPVAPVETPVLLQISDKKGRIVQAWWQDGAAFPAERVGEGLASLTPPKGWSPQPGDVVADAGPILVEPVAPTPPVVAEAPEAPDVVAEAAPAPGAYIDPFQDAKRRRVLRERSERQMTNDAGETLTVRTEIVSFVPDPSGGRPVSHGNFEQWLADTPEWQPQAARASGAGDGKYLEGWTGYRHPDYARKLPVIRVSFAAARAYCADFNTDLAPATLRPSDAFTWEFRLDGDSPVRVSPEGKLKPVANTAETFADTGFRCR